ncbi:MAG TPA: tetratricopeptide repeat protein [Pirellulales bacterium]|nr:tetratricopeptide repeat protein [Pirellulales bacterium]
MSKPSCGQRRWPAWAVVPATICLFCVLQVAGQSAPAEEPKADSAATREYAVATGLQNKQLYPQAAARWQKFIETFRSDARLDRAHFHLGACQLQAGEPAKAAATFRTLLQNYPNFAARDAAQYNLATALYKSGLQSKRPEDLKIAGEAFAQLVATYPQSKHAAAALFYQAESLYASGAGQAAPALYEKILANYPQSDFAAEARFALGAMQQESGQDAAASVTFQTFLNAHPQDAHASECKLRLGVSLLALKRYDEAQQMLAQAAAIADFPLADLALLRQAQCFAEKKQFDQAVALYQSLPGKFPKSKHLGTAQLAAGKLLYQEAKYPQAQGLLAAAVAANAEASAEAAYWLSKTLTKQNQAPAALAEIEKAVQTYRQSDFLPMLELGRIDVLYEIPERRKETVSLYAQFAAQHPEHESAPEAAYMAALSALTVGEFGEARRRADEFLANGKYREHALRPEVLFVAAESRVLDGAEKDRAPQTAKAESLYRELFAKFPMSRHAGASRVRVGLCLYMQKKYDPAIAELTQSIGGLADPSLAAEAQFLIGRSHRDANRWAQAAAAFRESLRLKPDWPRADEVYLALAESLQAQDDFAGAIAAATAVVDRFATGDSAPRARYLRALARQRLKQFQPAIEDLQNYLAAKPAPPNAATDALDARYAMALCQLGLKQSAQAAETLKAIVNEAPTYARADQVYYELGFALAEAKQEAAAAEAWRQLATKFAASPLEAESWFRVGEFHERSRQWPQALDAFRNGRKKAKTAELQEKLQFKLGWVQYQAEQFAPAAAAFVAQLQSFPAGSLAPDATYLAGECLFRTRKFAEALQRFDQSIQQKHEKYLARALYRAGASAAETKRWSASETYYRALVDQFPKFEQINEARYGLGLALQNQEKLAEARQVYEQVTRETDAETAAKSRFMVGECAFREKKYDEAVEHFLTAALGYPYEEWQALGYFEAGRCLSELKNDAKAIEMFDTVVKKFPAHPKAKDAGALSAKLKRSVKLKQ